MLGKEVKKSLPFSQKVCVKVALMHLHSTLAFILTTELKLRSSAHGTHLQQLTSHRSKNGKQSNLWDGDWDKADCIIKGIILVTKAPHRPKVLGSVLGIEDLVLHSEDRLKERKCFDAQFTAKGENERLEVFAQFT